MDLILRKSTFEKKKPIKNPEFKAETGLYGSSNNDFELTVLYDADIVKGDIITSYGSEWGGRIYEVEINNSTMTIKGKTFRGQMEMVSPNPTDTLSITGTDVEIIQTLINRTSLFYTVKDTGNTTKKTVVIPQSSNLLKAVDLVLTAFGEVMKIEVYSNVEIAIEKKSTHRYDYSQTELKLIESDLKPTALHSIGKVNGTETAVSVYLQADGTVGSSRYFKNFDAYEICESSNDDCPTLMELKSIVSDRLLALRTSVLSSEVDVKIDGANIGDDVNVTIMKYNRKSNQKIIAKSIEIINGRIKQKLITGG